LGFVPTTDGLVGFLLRLSDGVQMADHRMDLVDPGWGVSAVAAGRILNPKTARSQIIGGVVGYRNAPHEETLTAIAMVGS